MRIFNRDSALAAVAVFFAFGLVGPGLAFAAGPAAVNLGSAGNFAVLAKTGISTTGTTSIVGNIGVSPAAASYITGFGLTMDVSNTFSTSALVTGKVYAADYTAPTPTTMTTAISDLQAAYTDAAGRTNPTQTEMGAGSIGGVTLAPGLYKWSTNVTIPADITLSGGVNDVWIFQVAGTLTMSSATHIVLSGGAQASNVFWVVAGNTTIGTSAVFNGTILDQTTIVLNTGATLNGRAFAQAAVTLDANTVTSPTGVAQMPIPAVSAPTCATNTFYCVTVSAPTSSNATSGQQITIKSIAANLKAGSLGSDVTTLQQFLASQNKGSAARALASVGATGYFGALTRAALAEFQASVGISPALGNFGALTRAYLGAHY